MVGGAVPPLPRRKNETERERLKTEILSYNRDDVIATRKLEMWLRNLFR